MFLSAGGHDLSTLSVAGRVFYLKSRLLKKVSMFSVALLLVPCGAVAVILSRTHIKHDMSISVM